MGNRNRDRLAALNTAMKDETTETAVPPKTHSGVGSLLQREQTLTQLATGAKRTVQHLMHSPGRIRLWSGHNRDYGLLSIERCADLIDGFTRTGSQEFPAIVRKVIDDPDYDYEVICGARRHWTAGHLSWPLLIEVRDLDDRQAFVLQDLENRDREDVSDYERAVDYKKALPKYFENNRAAMAEFLEIDKGNFHRMLELAELPKALVDAYADLRELKVHHGTAYRKLMADSATKRRLMDRAKSLKGQAMPGAKVLSALKGAATSSRDAAAKATERRYGTIQVVRKSGSNSLQLTVPAPDGEGSVSSETVNGLRKAFDALLSDLQSGKL